MPLHPRRIDPGTTYHLISRFVDREWFIRSTDERELYLELLGHAFAKSDWRCLAYAVMSNHIHIAAIAGVQSLASWIRPVHATFAKLMNRAHDRIGSMFVRGPKSLSVDAPGIGSVISYIHNNPVRAKVVEVAGSSDWTSHRAYLGWAPRPLWLHVEDGLMLSRFKSASTFDEWVRDPERVAFDELHDYLVRQRPSVRASRRVLCVEPALIVAATAGELGISSRQLVSSRRGRVEVVGREVAVHSASRLGVSGSAIARALGVTQQAVSRILARSCANDVMSLSARVLQRLDVVSA